MRVEAIKIDCAKQHGRYNLQFTSNPEYHVTTDNAATPTSRPRQHVPREPPWIGWREMQWEVHTAQLDRDTHSAAMASRRLLRTKKISWNTLTPICTVPNRGPVKDTSGQGTSTKYRSSIVCQPQTSQTVSPFKL